MGTFGGLEGTVWSVAFAPNGQMLAVGSKVTVRLVKFVQKLEFQDVFPRTAPAEPARRSGQAAEAEPNPPSRPG